MFLIAGTALADKNAKAPSAIATRNNFRLEFACISTSPSHRMLAVSFLAARAASTQYEQIRSVANQAPLLSFAAHLSVGTVPQLALRTLISTC
jgi:hypothetical protein